jgi:hypothetical protein
MCFFNFRKVAVFLHVTRHQGQETSPTLNVLPWEFRVFVTFIVLAFSIQTRTQTKAILMENHPLGQGDSDITIAKRNWRWVKWLLNTCWSHLFLPMSVFVALALRRIRAGKACYKSITLISGRVLVEKYRALGSRKRLKFVQMSRCDT